MRRSSRGTGIEAGRNLGVIDMRQIAPTLARILGAPWSATAFPALPLATTE